MSAFLAYMAYLKTYLISLNFNFAKLEEKPEEYRPPTSRNFIFLKSLNAAKSEIKHKNHYSYLYCED